VRDDSLRLSLLASCFIHGAVIILASIILKHTVSRQDFLPISLVDVPRQEQPKPIQKVETPPEIKKPPPPPKVEKTKEPKPVAKSEIVQPKPPPPVALPKEEPAKPVETKPAESTKSEPPPEAQTARVEGGGSEAGAGNLFGKGDAAVVPGSATAGGGGGTASSGLGRESGAPGLPAQTLRTNREAKPVQTVRAVYPPIALRMGMEGDVTLRIEVDTEGKVTKAEITKSGGAGFDEEALKAVKQSRFEPAQKDGKNFPAEFTYIYRFRLQK
jgi:periplasmic protein TonB